MILLLYLFSKPKQAIFLMYGEKAIWGRQKKTDFESYLGLLNFYTKRYTYMFRKQESRLSSKQESRNSVSTLGKQQLFQILKC